ncbi:shikimate kinase [Trueperella bialowiezensis]|uniref:Shikimate kinase n=1 Tax=Trueperella bialowiezensis TaxID=312285 RepID=A0A448PC93_9ACTO|nr:hypothetical protein [Trueperella bialowiezensis]VEI12452.1 shikimate kinase [Trueperella bialowiezensis]
MSAIILVGASGTGKSSIVRELGKRGWVAGDVDHVVASQAGMNVTDYYLSIEPGTRNATIREALNGFFDDIASEPAERWALAIPSEVFSGKYDAEFAAERDRLGKLPDAIVVHLRADLSTLVTRNGLIGPRSGAMIMPRKEFRQMLHQREPSYAAVATHECDTTTMTPEQAADHILSFTQSR